MDAGTCVGIGFAILFISGGAFNTYYSYKAEKELYQLRQKIKKLEAKNDSFQKIIDDSITKKDIFLDPKDLEYYKDIKYKKID